MIVTRRGITWDVDEPTPTGPYVEGPFPGFWREWQADNWENDTLDVLDRFVKPGTTFVDLGACIGAHSMGAAERGAKVIAVEPDPAAFQFLLRNCARNTPDVVCVQAAIADHDGECQLAAHPQGWATAMSSVTRFDTSADSVTVTAVTLQTLFERYQIRDCSLVKMDIEGMEALVMESVGPFLAEQKIPLHLSTHEPYWPTPMLPEWFDCFGSFEFSNADAGFGGMEHVLCLP